MSQLSQILANQYFINGLSPLNIYTNGFIINISTLITAGYSLLDLKILGLSKSKFELFEICIKARDYSCY